jgi:energy-coupling factor transporter transmembrane protein EcfT
MIVWNIAYILYLLCNIAILLFDFPGYPFSAIVFLPLLVSLWLAGMVWAIILPVKAIWKKERRWYWAFLPLFCIIATTVLHFLPLPWHIWDAQITYLGNRNEWQEVIKNPAEENLISRTEQRTVIGFLHRESILTRYENRIVYISDDALPQKEMFPMAKKVTVYRKLAPNWYYLQVEY